MQSRGRENSLANSEIWGGPRLTPPPAVTTFVLYPAATGTGVVAPGFGKGTRQFIIAARHLQHDIGRGAPLCQFAGHEVHRRADMIKKGAIAGAKIIQTALAGRRLNKAVLGTAAIADKAHFAVAAVLRQGIALCLAELMLFVHHHNLGQRNIHDIAEFVIRLDIMVAGIDIAIVFHRHRQAAGFVKDAQSRRRTRPGSQRDIKNLHKDPADIMPHPFFINLNQKLPIAGRADRTVSDGIAFLIAAVIVAFDDGDELHELRPDLIAQECVDALAMFFVGGVDGGQDVELGIVFLQQFNAAHHLVEGGIAALVDAIEIVNIPRAIEADTNQEVVFGKELTPFVVQRDGIGLECIINPHAAFFVLLLKAHRLSKKFDAHQGRFAALPGKVDFVDRLGLDILADVFFQQAVGHAELAVGIEFFFGEEIAIFAVEVADGASRLGHHMKGGGLCDCCLHEGSIAQFRRNRQNSQGYAKLWLMYLPLCYREFKMGLMDELRKISEQVNQQRHLMTTEAATAQVSIRPFIDTLGYDTFNLNEVYPEYTADAKASGSERVDYAIMQQGKPIILIEAKSADKVLSENHWKQLYNYYGAEDVKFGILTNGIEYRFYTDLEKLNIMDKQPFLTVDMLNLDERLMNELEGFTKAGFDPERILSSARKLRVLRLLDKEYAQPSEGFIRFFARQIYTGPVSKSVIQEFAPVVGQAWREFVEQKIASRPPTAIEPGMPRQKPAKPKKRFRKPARLISGNTIEIPVFAIYTGHRFEATLFFVESNWKESRIRFEGEELSPSRAGKKAMRFVKPGISGPNGWTFWKLHNPDGNKERDISDLRDDEALRRRLLGMD